MAYMHNRKYVRLIAIFCNFKSFRLKKLNNNFFLIFIGGKNIENIKHLNKNIEKVIFSLEIHTVRKSMVKPYQSGGTGYVSFFIQFEQFSLADKVLNTQF